MKAPLVEDSDAPRHKEAAPGEQKEEFDEWVSVPPVVAVLRCNCGIMENNLKL
jgi:hypothetical protein